MKFKKILTSCKFIETKHLIPRVTLTGVLFPFYTPFTVKNSNLIQKIPQKSTSLPFHVTTNNVVQISFHQHEFKLQAHTQPENEDIETLTLSQEELSLLENSLLPIPWENIINYISWAVGGTVSILLLPFFTCLCIHIKKYKTIIFLSYNNI